MNLEGRRRGCNRGRWKALRWTLVQARVPHFVSLFSRVNGDPRFSTLCFSAVASHLDLSPSNGSECMLLPLDSGAQHMFSTECPGVTGAICCLRPPPLDFHPGTPYRHTCYTLVLAVMCLF